MLNINHNSKREVSRGLLLAALFSAFFFLVAVPYTHAEDFDVVGGAIGILANIIYPLALGVGGLFLGIGGLALDFAFRELVVGMGELLNGGYGLGIIQVWQIIRDVFNIVFIFSFIFLGIKTILNADDSGTKRALGHLIIAALFINFSLLITQVIIDFSNVAATQMYNQIITGGTGGTGTSSLTGAFMEIVSMNSFFGDNSGGLLGMQLIVYSLLMMIFFILAGIIFLFGAYHVIYRFVALGIYMILSPVLFLGLILPNFKGYTDKWIKGLLRQSFFAPAFVFIIYVALLTLQRLKEALGLSSTIGYSVVMEGSKMTVNEFTIFIFFGVGLGFLYASVKVGDLMGISGASGVVNGINSVVKNARGSLQSAVYRGTAGRALNWGVGRMDALDQSAEKGSRTARFARTIMGGESARKALEKGSNYGAGGMGRDAAEKQDKERSQRAIRSNQINKISGTLKTGSTAARERALADASNAQILEMLKDDDSKKLLMENAGKLSTSQFDAVIKSEDIDDKYRSELGAQRGTQIGERLRTNTATGAVVGIEEVIGKADISDLKALGFETALTHAGKLSSKQIDDWKELTPSEKTQIKTARKKQLEDEFATDAAALFTRISSDEERSKLPDTILTDEKAAEHLNNNVLTKIVDNNGITQAQRSTIKDRVIKHHYTSEVQDYESKTKKYQQDSAKYNAMDPEDKKKTVAPTQPDKPAAVGKYEKVVEYFEKNNAGQRY